MATTAEMIEWGPLDALEGIEGIAERLVLMAHCCVDWDVWGGPRRVRYWDALGERVMSSCYAGPAVTDWWAAMVRAMTLHDPWSAEQRAELAILLACDGQRPVLDALRRHSAALVLRVRVLSEARRAAGRPRT